MRRLKSSLAEVEVYPEYGGMINSFKFYHYGSFQEVLYGYVQDEITSKIHQDFRNVKLSPFPNRISRGQYNFDGRSFCLPLNKCDEGNSLHGFLYDKVFKVLSHHRHELIICYHYDGSIIGYPFNYKITVSYELKDSELCCSTTIKNTGNGKMPIGDGFHPYFSFGNSINTLKLCLPQLDQLELDHRMIPTGNFKPFSLFSSPKEIGEIQFDNCFRLNDVKDIVKTDLFCYEKKMRLSLWQKSQEYKFLQLYTPSNRKSIAIEPMVCAPDVFNNQMGLIVLDSNQETKFTFGFNVTAL